MAEVGLVAKENKTLWSERMVSWEKSGLTQPEFCKQHNITLASFGYWRTRLKKLAQDSDTERPVNFHPVKVRQDNSRGLTLTINGHCSIEVQPGFDRCLLIDVIQAVQSI